MGDTRRQFGQSVFYLWLSSPGWAARGDALSSPWSLPDEAQWLDLPVRRGRDLHRGTVEGIAYAHNPGGVDALALLSARASRLLDAADGRPVGQILASLRGREPEDATRWLAELPLLWRNGFVVSPGIAVPPPTKAERVFNVWLHLTNACNLACPYCYIHKSKRHMSAHVVERVLASLAATAASGLVDRIHVRYAGGEPMLRFAAMRRFHAQASEVCAAHGVKFSAAVLTNGAAVPEGATQWLRDNQVSVSMSIDGVGELQDTMRPVVGGGSSFARVVAGLDTYLAAGIRPYMLITVGDSNLDGLPALTQLLLGRGLWFRYSLVRDLQWGAGVLDDRRGAVDGPDLAGGPSTELLAGAPLRRVQAVFGRCYDQIEAHVRASGALALAAGTKPDVGFRRGHHFCDLQPWAPIRQACGAGRSYVAIGETGQVSPCQAALHRDGTDAVSGQSLLAIATGQTQLPNFARQQPNDVCRRCPHRLSCAGGCPLLLHRREGHVNGRSPYCEVFKAVLPRIVHIAAVELVHQARFARTAAPTTAKA